MAIIKITNWHGDICQAATSRRDVIALVRVEDNLLCGKHTHWPLAPLTQKYHKSGLLRHFDSAEQEILTHYLGYYCDLQSMHSEDAITWSFFGTLLAETDKIRVSVLNWLCRRCKIIANNTYCAIDLFQRIPHPDSLILNGPELDVLLQGDMCIIYVEAKWLSSEGERQGKSHQETQLQLRQKFLHQYGEKEYGPGKQFVVLSLVLKDDAVRADLTDDRHVAIRSLRWRELCGCAVHPLVKEYSLYYRWKLQHTRLRKSLA